MSKKIPKPLEEMISRAEALDVYTFALNHRHEDFIINPKQELIKEKGLDAARAYVKTVEGREDYGKRGADKLKEIFFEEFNVDKSNYNKSELETLTKTLYGMNKKNISEAVARHGLELDVETYKEEFLGNHLSQIKQYVVNHHIKNYDAEHNPAILDHILHENHKTYFREDVLPELKTDRAKDYVVNSFLRWKLEKKQQSPLGVKDIKDTGFSEYLKKEYLKQ